MKRIICSFLLLMVLGYAGYAQQTGVRKLEPMTPGTVHLTAGILKDQVDQVKAYYLNINNDALLKGFRLRRGLPTNGAPDLGGLYTSDIFNVFGQIVSGLCRFYAVTGDVACKAKADYLISEWAKTIDPDGYFYYTTHPNDRHYTYDKMAGAMVDAYVYTQNTAALTHLSKITDWAIINLSQARPYAAGGEWYTLTENLYRAYLATNDIKYKNFGQVWEYTEYWNFYKNGLNPFTRVPPPAFYHAYSHVNTLCGAGAAFLVKNDTSYITTLVNSYKYLQNEQCYATGGYGPFETLQKTKTDLVNSLPNGTKHFETQCGSWAGFKLSKYLVTLTGDAKYGDWAENLMINGIGASIPMTQDGRVMYYSDYNIRQGIKVNVDILWACCSGTRPEAVSEYANLIYFRKANNTALYASLFASSTVDWNGIRLTQTTSFPESNQVTYTISGTPTTQFSLNIRKPGWLSGAAVFTVNGQPVTPTLVNNWYSINRTWQNGDKVSLVLPMSFTIKRLDSTKTYPAAINYGPVVMAAATSDSTNYPSTLLTSGFTPASGSPLTFNVNNIPGQVIKPFYQYKSGEPYAMYIDTTYTNMVPIQNFTSQTGTWTGVMGAFMGTKQIGSSATFTMYGNALRLTGKKYANSGIYTVTVDGKLKETVDEYDLSGSWWGNTYHHDFTGLGHGNHTIVITLIGKNPVSTDSYINFSYSYQLPSINFNLSATNATCKGTADGSITVAATPKLNYIAAITGNGLNSSYSFTTTQTINNLAAGTYHICITIPSLNNYQKCYDTVITEPKNLTINSAINHALDSLKLTLAGANTYNIVLNGKHYITTQNTITLPVIKGDNTITISTDKTCQGTIEKHFNIAANVIPYPIPFQDILNLNLGNKNIGNITIKITDLSGNKSVYTHQFSNRSGVLQLDASKISNGVYILSMSLDNSISVFKVIKK